MRLLDLFCGAGGAAMGYHRAGFEVVGVDIEPQPRYPFRFIQEDALLFPFEGFDVIHASPVCKGYSALRVMHGEAVYPLMVADMRDRLAACGLPWVLENVVGAPMHQGMMICGTALGLNVRRHRVFDSSHLLWGPGPCRHSSDNVNVYGHGAWNYRTRGDSQRHWTRTNSRQCPVSNAEARAAMGIAWMNRDELSQAIPPAYTEYIGRQLMSIMENCAA